MLAACGESDVYLFVEVEIWLKETLAEDVLEFLDEDVFGVEEADEGADHVVALQFLVF